MRSPTSSAWPASATCLTAPRIARWTSSPFESSGATLSADDLATLLDDPRVAGIGELMNFPAVLNGDPEFLKRAALGERTVADGHAPGLSGALLNAYVFAGAGTDHECTTAAEAREKMRCGMHIHIREGSTERNLVELLGIITPANACNASFVTDDKHPDDLLNEGHLDHAVRLAISKGLPPVTAIQMVTINTARTYWLRHIGAVAPGYWADCFLTASLEQLQPTLVLKRGAVVARAGACVAKTGLAPALPGASMNVKPLPADPFRLAAAGAKVRVINTVEHQIITTQTIEPAPAVNGCLISDPARDLLKIAVIERHRATGNIGVGIVHGFGLTAGALASTVAHDAHNIIVVGANDADMRLAAQTLIACGGGLTAVKNGAVLATLPLPIAGLMSELRLEDVVAQQGALLSAARALGCGLRNPFMTLSFLALTPIPALRITDQGLVDATKFQRVSLFA